MRSTGSASRPGQRECRVPAPTADLTAMITGLVAAGSRSFRVRHRRPAGGVRMPSSSASRSVAAA